MTAPDTLTLDLLRNAVKTAAAFRCRRRLQPAGGEGDKVFPPTFAGAVYAIEKRRVPGREGAVQCVLLDSVQSCQFSPDSRPRVFGIGGQPFSGDRGPRVFTR
jgi:hypothetical protein